MSLKLFFIFLHAHCWNAHIKHGQSFRLAHDQVISVRQQLGLQTVIIIRFSSFTHLRFKSSVYKEEPIKITLA